MSTKGFCSALLRCGEIRLIAEKREYAIWETLESVSSCTRFLGIFTISSFGFNRGESFPLYHSMNLFVYFDFDALCSYP